MSDMHDSSSPVIDARGLRKTFGGVTALDGVDLTLQAGRIVGLIGANGAGKTTLINAVLGLVPFDGHLRVLGRDPWNARSSLMHDVAFISDVAVLPRWMRVSQLVEYMSAVHPRFDAERARSFLERTTIDPRAKVRTLSKGMVTQLHLALVMAIDAQLLVLDEPTLGLDIIYRKRFYDALLEDYLERNRTIVLATHNVDEIEHVVTDVIFMDRGRVALSASTEEIESRYREVRVRPDAVSAARALSPISERSAIGHAVMLFDGVASGELEELGDVRVPSVADLFVARLDSVREGR